mmetsp:Transcript_8884/g.14794  ORF Transcript_8884/g.14794 Transcript_8884/m.14794 type:complete len:261 (-) Transcript_8884:104-886(-)
MAGATTVAVWSSPPDMKNIATSTRATPPPIKAMVFWSISSATSCPDGVNTLIRFSADVSSQLSIPSSIKRFVTTPFSQTRTKRLERTPTPNPMSSARPSVFTSSASPSAKTVMACSRPPRRPAFLAHSSLTNLSLVVTTAIVLTPSLRSWEEASMKPGKCSLLQVGVKAPGMPTRTDLPSPPKTSLASMGMVIATISSFSAEVVSISTSIAGMGPPRAIGLPIWSSSFLRKRPKIPFRAVLLPAEHWATLVLVDGTTTNA